MQLFSLSKNSMPRFKILFFLLGPFLVIYFFYFLAMDFYFYPYANPRAARAQASVDYARFYASRDVHYLVLGDSSSLYGIIPKNLPGNSVSFSMIAASLFSSAKILEQVKNLKIKKSIILTQSFINDHYDQNVWGLFVPMRIYSYAETLNLLCGSNECSWSDYFLINLKYAMAKCYLSDMSINYFRERMEQLDMKYNRRFYNNYMLLLKEGNGHFTRKGSFESSREKFLLPYLESFSRPIQTIPEIEFISLKKILQFASDQNVLVYYVIMPTAATALGVSTEAYRNSIKSRLRPFESANFIILDASDYEKQLTIGDFWDYSHLNNYGARKFTEHLRGLIP